MFWKQVDSHDPLRYGLLFTDACTFYEKSSLTRHIHMQYNFHMILWWQMPINKLYWFGCLLPAIQQIWLYVLHAWFSPCVRSNTSGKLVGTWWKTTFWCSTLKIVLQVLKHALGVVAEWSKVLIPVPWSLMVWSTLALGK